MNCPKCGNPLNNTYKCSRCGHADPIMQKIIHASNWHYNQGLAKAKVKDLTGAMNSLLQSLKYNKRNTKARNLLGLVYYQTGEIVTALGEWVISQHFQGENNPATVYINAIQSNPGKLLQANKTIRMYNQALQYIEQNNADLAIIELKKAVNQAPNYIKAYQLLGLLYFERQQYAAARKVFLQALKVDRNNITTLRYMEQLQKVAGRKGIKTKTIKNSEFTGISDPNPVVIEEGSHNSYTDFNTGLLSFVNVIIGIVIGVAVVWILIVPSVKKKQTTEYNQAIVEYSQSISEKNSQITNLQNEVGNLTAANTELNNQLDKYTSSEDAQNSDTLLIQAVSAFFDEDMARAGEIVGGIDSALLGSEEARSVYGHIYSETRTTASTSVFNQAYADFEAENFTEAISGFTKVLNLNPESSEAIYYLGRCYHRLADLENASLYYNRYLTEFPNGSRAEEIQGYKSEFNAG